MKRNTSPQGPLDSAALGVSNLPSPRRAELLGLADWQEHLRAEGCFEWSGQTLRPQPVTVAVRANSAVSDLLIEDRG